MAAAVLLLSASAAFADCAHPETISASDLSATAASGAIYCYQVTAQAGQQINLSVTSANGDVVFAVFAPGWQVACTGEGDCDVEGEQLSEDEAKSWSDTAPSNGSYLIVIDNLRSDADYELAIDIH
ncbi:MAG TPA: hypothetical protein VM782_03150 [Stellaceae bacterium]|nr:hypothetical protein [Stellaceae bacterium]